MRLIIGIEFPDGKDEGFERNLVTDEGVKAGYSHRCPKTVTCSKEAGGRQHELYHSPARLTHHLSYGPKGIAWSMMAVMLGDDPSFGQAMARGSWDGRRTTGDASYSLPSFTCATDVHPSIIRLKATRFSRPTEGHAPGSAPDWNEHGPHFRKSQEHSRLGGWSIFPIQVL